MSCNGNMRNLKGQMLRRSKNSYIRKMANGKKSFTEELQDHLAKKALAENERKRAVQALRRKDDTSFIRKLWNAVRGLFDRFSTFSQQF